MMADQNTLTESTCKTPLISRNRCLSSLRYIVRSQLNFDAHQSELKAWLTHTGELYVHLEYLLYLFQENLVGRTAAEIKNDKISTDKLYIDDNPLRLLIEYRLLMRASILHIQWDGEVEILAEIHPDLIWDVGEKRPCRWDLIVRTGWNLGFYRPILDVPPIFQSWPRLALLHERYPTPSVHRPESLRRTARHEALAIYPSEEEIVHLRRARRISK